MCGALKHGCMGHRIAAALVVVGALNWGLVGLFQYNLVMALFGSVSWLERAVYVLVGVAGVLMLVGCPCKKCKGDEMCCKSGACSEKPKM